MDLKRILASKPRKHAPEAFTPLQTPWGEKIDAERVLPEHPNPQAARQDIRILNGWWDYAFAPSANAAESWRHSPIPTNFDGKILVPFSPEAPLSGVNRQLQPSELLWYRTTIDDISLAPDTRCLLHFEAVDFACSCYCNGQRLGQHEGGYHPFYFDITDQAAAGSVELALCVYDPSDAGTQPRGKQKLERGNIWYTAQSGIWQTVWLEFVPEAHLASFTIAPSLEAASVAIHAQASQPGHSLAVQLLDAAGAVVAEGQAAAREEAPLEFSLSLALDNPQPWSPDSPYLYGVRLRYGEDEVRSYCAFRTTRVQLADDGRMRFFLNGEPLQLRGVLDQGYWPDGLMTAPADEALVFDIETAKRLGFNTMRKHLKVEARRWYYHCDRLGMLVWQDMVSGGGPYSDWHTSHKPTLFKASWTHFADDTKRHHKSLSSDDANYQRLWEEGCRQTIELLGSHPCVVTWSLFNEGWGQFDAVRNTLLANKLDPTRPIDATSGWYDQRCGSYFSIHNYFRELEVYPEPDLTAIATRAFALSEFGGLTWHVAEHSALARSYGYQSFETAHAWAYEVIEQLATAQALEDDGLAAFVYTQLTDVEEETNGLLTYDRRVNKLEAAMRMGETPTG